MIMLTNLCKNRNKEEPQVSPQLLVFSCLLQSLILEILRRSNTVLVSAISGVDNTSDVWVLTTRVT